MKGKRTRGLLAWLLAAVMVVSLLPLAALPALATEDGLRIAVSSNNAAAGAKFSVLYYAQTSKGRIEYIDADGRKVDSFERTYDASAKAEMADGLQKWFLYISLNSYDADNYFLTGFVINGVHETDPDRFYKTVGGSYMMIDLERQTREQFLALSEVTVEALFVPKDLPAAHTPTVTVAAEDAAMGAVGALYCVGETEGGSEWNLTAQLQDGYQLAYLRETDDPDAAPIYSENGTSVRWTLSEDKAYTAHFEKAAMHIWADGMTYAPYMGASKTDGYLFSRPVAAGQRVGFCITYSTPSNVPGNSTFRYALYAGTDTSAAPLASYSYQNPILDYARADNRVILSVDPIPAELEAVTAVMQLGDGPVTSRTFPVSVGSSGELDLRFFTVPQSADLKAIYPSDCRTSVGGPHVYDVLPFVDEGTGALSLYLAVSGGVMKYDPAAATDLVYMDGMLFGYNDNEGSSGHAVALGGTDEDHLAALVKTASGSFMTGLYNTFCVYKCVDEVWTKVEGSELPKNYNSAVGLAMTADDIWTADRHWDGTEWSESGYNFNSFWKEDGGSAYAGSADGLYHYDGADWTKVNGVTGAVRIDSAARSGGKVLIVNAEACVQPRVLEVANGAASAYPIEKTEEIISGNQDATFYYNGHIGIDESETLYGFIGGRGYPNGFASYTGTYVYEWTGDGWAHKNVPAFNDPNEDDDLETKLRADGVTRILNPCEGVSLFLGPSGAIYGKFGSATIRFESNGGNEVQPLTQSILSPVSPPAEPEREGYTFVGWYTLADFLRNGPAYTWGVMPAKDLTLYAKWVENGSGGDVFATERSNALNSLDTAYGRLTQSEYSAEVWGQIRTAYTAGQEAIRAATTYNGIYAALNSAVDQINALSQNTNQTITVAVTVEKLTVDGEYIIEPTLVEVKKFSQASVVVTDLLKEKYADSYDGTPYRYTGSEKNGFYLAGVYDPTYIPALSGPDREGKNSENEDYDQTYEGFLSELDGGRWPGWMYCVNGVFPGVGSSGWTMMDGEVMRWQYSCVGLGCDIGADNSEWGATESTQVADKDALIWKVAEINRAGTRSDYGVAYTDAMTALKTIDAPQDDVDAALAALNAIDGSGTDVTVANNENTGSVAVGEKTMNVTANGAAVTATVGSGSVVTLTVQTKKTANSQQVDSTRITLTGTAAYTDGSNSFTVTSTGDVPCVILVKKADGSYERRAVATAAGVHTVTLAADEEIVVAVKGDATGDGRIDASDWSAVIARFKSGSFAGLPVWMPLLCDVTADGKLNASDWSALIAAFIGVKPLAW